MVFHGKKEKKAQKYKMDLANSGVGGVIVCAMSVLYHINGSFEPWAGQQSLYLYNR